MVIGAVYNIRMRTLFVCTGNTCRSPMAERMARHFYPGHEWESAGVMPQGGIHPMSARVLDDHGCDATGFEGRNVADLDLGAFDQVVLIGETAQACSPDPPAGVEVHHWDVPDPYEVRGSEKVILAAYEESWADLKHRIAKLVAEQEG